MEIFQYLLSCLFLAALLLPGPVFTILNIRNLILKREHTGRFEALAFLVGIVYSFLLYGFWGARPWEEPILLNVDLTQLHEPFDAEHAVSLLVLMAAGLLAYGYLKARRHRISPLAAVISMSGVYLGIFVNAAVILQLFGSAGADLPFSQIGFLDVFLLMLVPFNYLLLAADLLVRVVREQRERLQKEDSVHSAALHLLAGEEETGPYKSRLLNRCNRVLAESENWTLYALLLALPLLCLIIAVLLLFGQKPDSVIRVFTQTSEWTLSGEISPPPVEIDNHYLCTVALRGHKELVKPVRMGLRRGEKIVVNRQLCVANAFEQLLEERTPRFHRALRHFYDTYGYPISRYIRTPLAADGIYLMMKPLEWMFVTVLYLFDEKPESRIARQYLPMPIPAKGEKE